MVSSFCECFGDHVPLKWALFENSRFGKRETYRFQANRTRKWALFENSSSGKRETYRFQANRTVASTLAGKHMFVNYKFVDCGAAEMAHAILIDEGAHFYHRPAHPHSRWIDWQNGVKVLFSQAVVRLA